MDRLLQAVRLPGRPGIQVQSHRDQELLSQPGLFRQHAMIGKDFQILNMDFIVICAADGGSPSLSQNGLCHADGTEILLHIVDADKSHPLLHANHRGHQGALHPLVGGQIQRQADH